MLLHRFAGAVEHHQVFCRLTAIVEPLNLDHLRLIPGSIWLLGSRGPHRPLALLATGNAGARLPGRLERTGLRAITRLHDQDVLRLALDLLNLVDGLWLRSLDCPLEVQWRHNLILARFWPLWNFGSGLSQHRLVDCLCLRLLHERVRHIVAVTLAFFLILRFEFFGHFLLDLLELLLLGGTHLVALGGAEELT